MLTNTAVGIAASIAATGGNGQAATANGSYAAPLQARVVDAGGRGVQGASVSFVVASGPTGAGATFLGGGAQATETTDASGLATSPPLAGRPLASRNDRTSGLPASAATSLS